MTEHNNRSTRRTDAGQPTNCQVRTELIRSQIGHSFALAITIGVSAAFLLIWLWPRSGLPVSVLWLPGLFLVAFSFGSLYYTSRFAGDDTQAVHGQWFSATSLAGGILWCVGILTVYQWFDQQDQWLLVATYGAVVVGATSMQAAMPKTMLLTFLPGLALLFSFQLIQLTLPDTLLAAIVFAITVMAYRRVINLNRDLMQTILTQMDAAAARTKIYAQAEELARLVKLKDHFLAAVSHDLRQPAQAIGLLSQSVQEATRHSEVQSQAGALVSASDQISELISRLLDLARLDLERDKPIAQWVEIQAVYAHLASALELKARQVGVSLQFGGEKFSMRADPLYVERILQNLIVNAIEHANASVVSVETKVLDPLGSQLSVLVVDNGIGLDQERCQAVRRPVYWPEIDRSNHSVQGLGLSITTQLARLGGYRLDVKAQAGAGTCFELRFDQWRGEKLGPESIRPEAGRSQVIPIDRARRQLRKAKLQVLIIEDDALVRVGLMSMISSAGFQVTACDSGGDAMDAIHTDGCRPDIILADWFLENGVTAANAMPAVQAALAVAVPVIILTGQRSVGLTDEELSRRVGGVPVRFLQKPVRVELLIRRIRELLDEAASL